MGKPIILLLILLFSVLPNNTWAQTDSLKIDKVNPVLLYIGFGGGPNTRGGNLDLNFSVISSGGFGGSFHFISGGVKMKNVPSDYGGQFGRLPPFNDFTILSFNFLKNFSASERYLRFGFETGPSWVRYDLIELELNPYYPGVFQYKYNKIHTVKSTVGLSAVMKVDFPFSRFFGCDLAFFGIINKLQSVVGLDICLNLGMVR